MFSYKTNNQPSILPKYKAPCCTIHLIKRFWPRSN